MEKGACKPGDFYQGYDLTSKGMGNMYASKGVKGKEHGKGPYNRPASETSGGKSGPPTPSATASDLSTKGGKKGSAMDLSTKGGKKGSAMDPDLSTKGGKKGSEPDLDQLLSQPCPPRVNQVLSPRGAKLVPSTT